MSSQMESVPQTPPQPGNSAGEKLQMQLRYHNGKAENCQPAVHSDSSPSYCILMTPAKITQSCPLQLLKIDECHLNLTVAAGGSSAQAKVLTVSEVLMNFM